MQRVPGCAWIMRSPRSCWWLGTVGSSCWTIPFRLAAAVLYQTSLGLVCLFETILHPACCNWQGASFQVDLTVWVGQPRKAPSVVTFLAVWGRIRTPWFQSEANRTQHAVVFPSTTASRSGFGFWLNCLKFECKFDAKPSLASDPRVSMSSLGQPRNNAMSRPGRRKRSFGRGLGARLSNLGLAEGEILWQATKHVQIWAGKEALMLIL